MISEPVVVSGAFAWAKKQAELQRGVQRLVVSFRRVRRWKWVVEAWDARLGIVSEEYVWTERGARRRAYRLARILGSNNFDNV
jgi:hypothetical protein